MRARSVGATLRDVTSETAVLRIDDFLPDGDESVFAHTVVDASPTETYEAIGRADITADPLTRALSALRDLPNRVSRRLRGEEEPRAPRTFRDIMDADAGWVVLADEHGHELVVGLVGAFWRRDYGVVHVSPDEFTAFTRPGFAKVAVSFTVRPYGARTLLTYETRTKATDPEALRTFRRYWRIVGPGARLLMRGGLKAVKAEAERKGRTGPAPTNRPQGKPVKGVRAGPVPPRPEGTRQLSRRDA